MPTPQGLVSAHQPLFSVVQGGLATGGTAGGVVTGAAATAGGLVGGVPFSPYAHHPALAAAASATQQPGGGGGAGGVASQPLAGTPGMKGRERERERERGGKRYFCCFLSLQLPQTDSCFNTSRTRWENKVHIFLLRLLG